MPRFIGFGPKFRAYDGTSQRRFFAHGIRLRPLGPVLEFQETRTTDEPYLVGKSVILHLWPTKLGLVIGRWHSFELNEFAHLYQALRSIPKDKLPLRPDLDTVWEDDLKDDGSDDD
jgi:hypothetical protein